MKVTLMKLKIEMNILKKLLLVVVLTIFCAPLQAEEGFKPLFNGKNLNGWKSVKDEKAKGSGAFSVNKSEKAIHVYADRDAGSKQAIDCLYTKKEYSHYILKLEYKWLEKRFPPRADHDRDAGLLFHLNGNLTKLWPHCLEMQLGESDTAKVKDRYATGDLWIIGKDIQAMNARDSQSFYSPGSPLVPVGKNQSYDKSFIPLGNEKAHGEWNEITLTVRGGQKAIFELNGKIVNQIQDMTTLSDGERVPLEKGPIGLQAEYAELFYRNIRIKVLNPN